MASWDEFFRMNNCNYSYSYSYGAPDWMASGSGSVAAQVIRYPAQPYDEQPHNNCFCGAASVEYPRVIRMELNVPICCEGCEERVLSRLIDIDGVQSVKCDQLKQKVTVSGSAAPAEVLAACKKLFKRSKWWSS